MKIVCIIKTYKEIKNKNKICIFFPIAKYIFDRGFRISVDIYSLLKCKSKFLRKIKRNHLLSKYGCDIGENVKIEKNFGLPHPNGVVIGNETKIGCNCRIYQNVTIGKKSGKYPVIGDNVIIYPNSVVIGGIKIGNNSIIGAGSVVIHDVQENAIIAGNPAKEVNHESNRNLV